MAYMPEAMLVFNVAYLIFAAFSIQVKTQKVSSKTGYETEDFLAFLEKKDTQKYIIKYGCYVYLVSMALSLFYYSLTGRGIWFMLTLGQGSERRVGRAGPGIYFLMQFIRSAIPGIMLLIAFSKQSQILVYLGAYILSCVCISTGSRNLAICVVLSFSVYYYLKQSKRPAITTILIAIAILLAFVVFIGLFRRAIKSGADIDVSTVKGDSAFRAFMYNVEIFYPFFTLVGYMWNGSVSCHWGLGILNIFIQFIPRALWKSKPATLGLTAFEAMYGDSMGGAAYPNIGEFYYEFGMIGAIVGMAAFGFFSQEIYRRTLTIKNKLSMIEYAMFFGYLMQFICRGHFASWAIDFVFMYGPIWLLKKKLWRQYKWSQRQQAEP